MALKPTLLALLAALPLAAGHARAQQTLGNTRALVFGRFVAGTGGTITVSPSGARSSTGGVVLLSSFPSAAGFSWTDTNPDNAGKACIISLPPDGTVVLSNGVSSMALSQFTSTPSGTGLMSGGTLQFAVGATLSVGANQPSGSYAGAVPVSIEYQ